MTKWWIYPAGVFGLYALVHTLKKGMVSGLNVTKTTATSYTVTATVKNTGNTSHTFPLGCSVGKPGPGIGCEYGLSSPSKDLPFKNKTLNPGDSSTVSWSFDDSGLDTGTNHVIVKVYEETVGGEGSGCFDTGYAEFNVAEVIAAEITSVTIS